MGPVLTATISTSAIAHNLKVVRSLCPRQKVLAMIKADGYGHGLINVAKALSEADAFGVARIHEATALDGHTQNLIVLMEGVQSKEELDLACAKGYAMVVHSLDQAMMLKEHPQTLPFWLKLNVGMNRLGMDQAQAILAWELLKDKRHAMIGWMGHLAQADELDLSATNEQTQRFVEWTQAFEGQRTLANSAGVLHWSETHFDWVRPGIMLYGASPIEGTTGVDHGLRPAMELNSTLIAVQHVKKGEAIGYGATFTAANDLRIGVVAAGYGDGYPRHAQTGTPVLVEGEPSRLVARVSMDMLTVDITHIPQATVGSSVTLWGTDLPIEQVAHHAGTISYELYCQLTNRVHHQWID